MERKVPSSAFPRAGRDEIRDGSLLPLWQIEIPQAVSTSDDRGLAPAPAPWQVILTGGMDWLPSRPQHCPIVHR